MENKVRKPYPKQRAARTLRNIERFCEICGKKSLLTLASFNKGKGKFCSKSCSNIAVGLRFKGKTHSNLPSGEKHHHWKDWSQCNICGDNFKTKLKHGKLTQCCSVKCRGVYVAKSQRGVPRAEPIKCLFCGVYYQKKSTYIEGKIKPEISQKGKMFCSRSCSILSGFKGTQLKIFETILNEGLSAELEKSFDWLINPNTGRHLWVDIFIESINLAIEYDGPQHSKTGMFAKTESDLHRIKSRDLIKTELLKKHNITLIRLNGKINYKEMINSIKKMQVPYGK